MVKKKVRSGCKWHHTAQVVGGQSETSCSEYSTSCGKNQVRKEEKMKKNSNFPAIKGGCGHSDREVEHSAIAVGVCFAIGTMLIIAAIIF